MKDERLDTTKDFRPKSWQLAEWGTLCPEKFKDLEDTKAIEQYLNKLEKLEKRKDAQLLREIEVAIPKEFNSMDRSLAVFDFAQPLCEQYGIRAIWSIHDKGDNNPHAHILLTLRAEEQDGTIGNKIREMNSKSWIKEQRERWASCCNQYLTPEQKIDHRTLEEQGSEKVPTAHVGWRVGKLKNLERSEKVQKIFAPSYQSAQKEEQNIKQEYRDKLLDEYINQNKALIEKYKDDYEDRVEKLKMLGLSQQRAEAAALNDLKTIDQKNHKKRSRDRGGYER